MKKSSILIAGGGSTYAPDIVLVLLNHPDRFPLRSIEFYDNSADRQRIAADVCEVLVHERDPGISFPATTDPETVFTGVDFVMIYIRAGKYAMRELDGKVPTKYNVVGQETCGPGGIAYDMRSVGAILELVDYIGKYSPRAWILNYSNPATIVAETTRELHPGSHILNICDIPVDIKRHIAKILHLDPRRDIGISYHRLNHFGWWANIKGHTGDDLMSVLEKHIKEKRYCVETRMYQHTDDSLTDTFHKAGDVCALDPDTLPNTYLKYYFYPDYVVKHTDPIYTRTNQVMDGREKFIFGECHKVVRAQSSEGADLHIDEHASYIVDLACALAYNTKEKMLLIAESNGAVQSFNPTAMVKVPCLVGSNGPQMLRVGDIPRFQKGLMEQQVAVEELVMEAWTGQSYRKLWQALALSRMVPSTSIAKMILDDLIEANEDYWPELK